MEPRETWQISSPDLELESPVHVLARVCTSNCWSRAGQVSAAARAISTEPTRRHSMNVIRSSMTGGRSSVGYGCGAGSSSSASGAREGARPPLLRYDIIFRWPSKRVQSRHNIDTIKSSEGNSTHIAGYRRVLYIDTAHRGGRRKARHVLCWISGAVLITRIISGFEAHHSRQICSFSRTKLKVRRDITRQKADAVRSYL